MRPWMRWAVVVVGGATTFIAILLVSHVVALPGGPQAETDRWAVAAGFGAAVSAGVLAGLAAWANRRNSDERSWRMSNLRIVDESDVIDVRDRSSSRLTMDSIMRPALLAVGVAGNFVVTISAIISVFGGLSTFRVAIVAFALAVLAPYMAHAAGRVRSSPTRTIAVSAWVLIGISVVSCVYIGPLPYGGGIYATPPEALYRRALVNAVIVAALYVATGIIAMLRREVLEQNAVVANMMVDHEVAQTVGRRVDDVQVGSSESVRRRAESSGNPDVGTDGGDALVE